MKDYAYGKPLAYVKEERCACPASWTATPSTMPQPRSKAWRGDTAAVTAAAAAVAPTWHQPLHMVWPAGHKHWPWSQYWPGFLQGLPQPPQWCGSKKGFYREGSSGGGCQYSGTVQLNFSCIQWIRHSSRTLAFRRLYPVQLYRCCPGQLRLHLSQRYNMTCQGFKISIATVGHTHHTLVLTLDLAVGALDFVVTHTVGATKAGTAQLATLATVLTVSLQVLWGQRNMTHMTA
jgi:hypothetical protein